MQYLDLFTTGFDPVSGDFSALSEPEVFIPIVLTARAILRQYESEQVCEIAEDAQWMVGEYFRVKKDQVIRQIKADGCEDEFLELDERGKPSPKDEARDHYDLRESDEMSSIEALSEAMDAFLDSKSPFIAGARRCHYVSVLALLAVNECIRRTQAAQRAGKWNPVDGWDVQATGQRRLYDEWKSTAAQAVAFAVALEKDENARFEAKRPTQGEPFPLNPRDRAELERFRARQSQTSAKNREAAAKRHADDRERALEWLRRIWPTEHSRHDHIDDALNDFASVIKEEAEVSLRPRALKPLLLQVIEETGLQLAKR